MLDEPLRDRIDATFRRLDREVWIVTASAGGKRGGLLATWVMQSSIDVEEPMLVAAIAANHYTAELIDGGGGFAAHLLRPNQTDLALRFALASGREVDKLQGLAARPGDAQCPILLDCAAWLDCRVVHRHDTGDRIYYWADVVDGEQQHAGPLLRQQQLFAAASETQRTTLRHSLLDDAQLQRPLRQRWRESLGRGHC